MSKRKKNEERWDELRIKLEIAWAPEFMLPSLPLCERMWEWVQTLTPEQREYLSELRSQSYRSGQYNEAEAHSIAESMHI